MLNEVRRVEHTSNDSAASKLPFVIMFEARVDLIIWVATTRDIRNIQLLVQTVDIFEADIAGLAAVRGTQSRVPARKDVVGGLLVPVIVAVAVAKERIGVRHLLLFRPSRENVVLSTLDSE